MNHSRRIIQVGMTMTQEVFSGSAAIRPRVAAAALISLLAAMPAHASFMQGETLAKAANVIAWVVILIVPIVAIVVFWLVHVLPEKIAHKRQHPQTEAIQVLCLLSLVFGGMLWPLAWLWAYSKPVLYKMAYGTDKAESSHAVPVARAGDEARDLRADVARLRADLEKLVSQGGAPAELSGIRDRLAALEPRLAANAEEPR
jgi:CBS domain containing-hemolysin-like protein